MGLQIFVWEAGGRFGFAIADNVDEARGILLSNDNVFSIDWLKEPPSWSEPVSTKCSGAIERE